jgi:hypothetical protein
MTLSLQCGDQKGVQILRADVWTAQRSLYDRIPKSFVFVGHELHLGKSALHREQHLRMSFLEILYLRGGRALVLVPTAQRRDVAHGNFKFEHSYS